MQVKAKLGGARQRPRHELHSPITSWLSIMLDGRIRFCCFDVVTKAHAARIRQRLVRQVTARPTGRPASVFTPPQVSLAGQRAKGPAMSTCLKQLTKDQRVCRQNDPRDRRGAGRTRGGASGESQNHRAAIFRDARRREGGREAGGDQGGHRTRAARSPRCRPRRRSAPRTRATRCGRPNSSPIKIWSWPSTLTKMGIEAGPETIKFGKEGRSL